MWNGVMMMCTLSTACIRLVVVLDRTQKRVQKSIPPPATPAAADTLIMMTDMVSTLPGLGGGSGSFDPWRAVSS